MNPSEKLSPEGRRVIDEFVRQRTRFPERFVTEISGEDEMYLFLQHPERHPDESHLRYFESGKSMLDEYRFVVDPIFGGFDRLDSVLEFACGHGRFTRFLVQELRAGGLVVSDIYTDAIDFQAKSFGVEALVSVPDPRDYEDDHRYQLILVSSLFSHLPAATFEGWLARLYELLTDDGVIVFSVHDEGVVPDVTLDESGFAFFPQSESRSLDAEQYGTTVVNESFVGRVIERACPLAGGYKRIPKGLWSYQDLYAVSRGGARDLFTAGERRGPFGYVDGRRRLVETNEVRLSGWALDDDPGAEVVEIEVLVNGDRAQTCLPTQMRLDVAEHFGDRSLALCGWACVVSPDQAADDDVVSVVLESSTGRRATIAFDLLRRLLAADDG